MTGFTHLHVHAEYSLLDGMSKIDELVERTRELGMTSLAITDHGAMYGVPKFYRAATAAGIKPIIGCEVYVAPEGRLKRVSRRESTPFHLILLVKNKAGYQNLIRLVTQAHLDGFYYKPRVDKELLRQYSEGLIATSACASGEIARLIQTRQLDTAREAVHWYRDTYGPRGFYLELQRHVALPDLEPINQALIQLGQDLQVDLVATNDVHYVHHDDAAAHEVLLCIQTSTTMDDSNRMRMGGDDFHLRSGSEMAALFADLPAALENTERIAADCNFELENEGFHLPAFEVPEGLTPQTYLAQLCEVGLARRYPTITPELRHRLEHELAIIHDMGFDSYFLIVWDLVRHAQSKGIWWNVRGSAAGSIVSYSLGLTNLEPLSNGLIFERFLNPGRITMPDIDLDFPDDCRDQMIEYVNLRYGAEQVAQIATFGTLAARASIRDVGRALGLPPGEVDRLAKQVPGGVKVKLKDALQPPQELAATYEQDGYIHDLIDTALRLEGIARHISTHAAGVVIADKALVEYAPVQRIPRGDALITQYAMDALEDIGLLKIDFLGLSQLTSMREAVALINQRHATDFTLENIPVNDPEIYALLSAGNVTGLFQVEGSGMRRVLQELQPSTFEDVVALLSLYRPGPMQFIENYVSRKHGQEKVEYIDPSLEPILRETYGIIVYQEQIIRIATDIAGYSSAEADLMRRAVGKKKEQELKSQKEKFVQGAVARGMPANKAEEIFSAIEYFANYGFNKAHSASYAVITCQTAFLKAHYTIEYMTALLSVERSNPDKVRLLVAECRRLGIDILPPDVSHSGINFSIETSQSKDQVAKQGIRFGLGAIKNIGESALQLILTERAAGGPFVTLSDLARRVDLRALNKRALECLIKAGALDCLETRPRLLALMDRMMSLSQLHHEAKAVGQLSFDITPKTEATRIELMGDQVAEPPISQDEMLSWEKDLLGVYVSEHPLQQLVRMNSKDCTPLDQIDESLKGHKVSIAGRVARVRTLTTRKGDEMSFVELEDLSAAIDVVVFPGCHQKFRELLIEDRLLIVEGRIDLRDGKAQMIADTVRDHNTAGLDTSSPVRVYQLEVNLRCSGNREHDVHLLQQAYNILTKQVGPDRFFFNVISDHGCVQLDFPNATTRFDPEIDGMLHGLLGNDAVHVTWTEA